MLGGVSEGIRMIEKDIARADATGAIPRGVESRPPFRDLHSNSIRKEKPAAGVLFRNFWTIIGALIFGASRARTLLQQAAATKMLSKRGVVIARINFDLGVLSAMKKKRDEARSYFEKARVGAERQRAEKLLQKIDASIAQLG